MDRTSLSSSALSLLLYTGFRPDESWKKEAKRPSFVRDVHGIKFRSIVPVTSGRIAISP